MVIAILAGLVAIVLIVINRNPFPVLIAGALVLFLVYALWDPPKKHKSYSLSDQQQATSHALGGSGPPDLSQFEQEAQGTHQKES